MTDPDSFIPALHKPSSLLPIASHKDALLYTIENNAVTVVVGQTGSGKTTQLPQYLERAGYCNDNKVIAITQARIITSQYITVSQVDDGSQTLTAPTSGSNDRRKARGRRGAM
jgi:ATP-dependent RNA helicase DDX35